MEYLSFQISVVQISLEHALFLCTSCFSSNSHFHMLYLHSKYGYVFFEITTSAVAVSYKPSFPHYGTPSLLNPSALQGNCYLVQPYCLVHSVIWAMLNQSENGETRGCLSLYFHDLLFPLPFDQQLIRVTDESNQI